jgi:hypothetical protein
LLASAPSPLIFTPNIQSASAPSFAARGGFRRAARYTYNIFPVSGKSKVGKKRKGEPFRFAFFED